MRLDACVASMCSACDSYLRIFSQEERRAWVAAPLPLLDPPKALAGVGEEGLKEREQVVALFSSPPPLLSVLAREHSSTPQPSHARP